MQFSGEGKKTQLGILHVVCGRHPEDFRALDRQGKPLSLHSYSLVLSSLGTGEVI